MPFWPFKGICGAALAWLWLYDSSSAGIINGVLKFFSVAPIPWLTNGKYALTSVTIEAIWATFGLNTVIFLAGLQNVPTEYYEAAELDGANACAQQRSAASGTIAAPAKQASSLRRRGCIRHRSTGVGIGKPPS